MPAELVYSTFESKVRDFRSWNLVVIVIAIAVAIAIIVIITKIDRR